MVRVISVYHFLSQTINTIKDDDIIDIIMLNSNQLILAKSNHTIEILDLVQLNKDRLVTDQKYNERHDEDINKDDKETNKSNPIVFSTVDSVLEMIYCRNGNYIATIEKNTQISLNSRKLDKFVRIYVNWDCASSSKSADMSLRARIAGKVTPLPKNTGMFLEMIELPLENEPKVITCCQSTGNLLINSNKNLLLYQFQLCANYITKQQYIDFIFIPIIIELHFIPKKIELVENLIIYMSDTNFHMFKLNKIKDDFENIDYGHDVMEDDVGDDNDDIVNRGYEEHDEADDLENSVTTNTDSDCLVYDDEDTSYVYWDDTMLNQKGKKGNVKYNLDYKQIDRSHQSNDNIVYVDLKCNSNASNKFNNCDEIRPTVVNTMSINIAYLHTNHEVFSSMKYCIENVLQLELKSQKIYGILRQLNDKFTCITTRPLYSPRYMKKSKTNKINTDNFFLLSKFNKSLLGCVVMMTTQQDGYLFVLNKNLLTTSKIPASASSTDQISSIEHLTTIYPFTSNVLDVKLDEKILHALTESGIETYTLNVCDILENYNKNFFSLSTVSRQPAIPIYLIGLRPIFGLTKLLIDNFNTNLILISRTVNKSISIYDLKLPTVSTLYNEFMKFAKIQDRSSTFYLELLKQSNLFLLATMELGQLTNNIKPFEMISSKNASLEFIYRESCVALGNYYVMSTKDIDYLNALRFYNLANLTITDIFNEIMTNGNHIAENTNYQLFNINGGKGLLYILRDFLLRQQNTSSQQLENIFTKNIKNDKFIDLVINFYDKSNNLNALCEIVLKTIHLHDYIDEKLFKIFMGTKLNRGEWNFEDEENLFIVLYLIKKNKNTPEAMNIINRIDMHNMMRAYWIILFDTILVRKKCTSGKQQQHHVISNFSEFSEFLILRTNETSILKLFNDILLHLIFELKKFSFGFILKLYLEFISTKLGISDSNNNNNNKNCLKLFLEKYFFRFYSNSKFTEDHNKLFSRGTNYRLNDPNESNLDEDDITTTASGATVDMIVSNNPDSTNNTNTNTLNTPATSSSSSSINTTTTNKILVRDMKNPFENQHHEGYKILIRLYLSQLRTLQPETEVTRPDIITPELIEDNFNNFKLNCDKMLTKFNYLKNEILFYDKRFNYLNLMLPFSYCAGIAETPNLLYIEKNNDPMSDNILVLIKLQAILCSDYVTSDIMREIQQFIHQSNNNNINLIGFDSIISLLNIITIDKKHYMTHKDNLILLLNKQPHIILEYGKCMFKTDLEWSNLIQMVNDILLKFEENEETNINFIFLYHRLMKEIFHHLATTKTRDSLQSIYNYSLNLYEEEKTCSECIINVRTMPTLDFNNYLKICVDKERSEKLRQMIMNAGHQLWDAINKHRNL